MKGRYALSLAGLAAVAGFAAGRFPGPVNAAANKSSESTGAASSVSRPERGGGRDAEGSRRDAKPGEVSGRLTTAMKGALGHTLESKRLDRWLKLLATMKPEDAPAIAALLREQELAGREFKPETMAFWQTWAEVDPQAALEYVKANGDKVKGGDVEALVKA